MYFKGCHCTHLYITICNIKLTFWDVTSYIQHSCKFKFFQSITHVQHSNTVYYILHILDSVLQSFFKACAKHHLYNKYEYKVLNEGHIMYSNSKASV
jgi:hypothetical protein